VNFPSFRVVITDNSGKISVVPRRVHKHSPLADTRDQTG